MSSTPGKSPHVSEKVTVKCRLCKIVLRRKNYKAHLKAVHPKDDPDDLSGWRQNKIDSMFGSSALSKPVSRIGSQASSNAGKGYPLSVSPPISSSVSELEESSLPSSSTGSSVFRSTGSALGGSIKMVSGKALEDTTDAEDVGHEFEQEVQSDFEDLAIDDVNQDFLCRYDQDGHKSPYSTEEFEPEPTGNDAPSKRGLGVEDEFGGPARKKRMGSGDSAFNEPASMDPSDAKFDQILYHLQKQQQQLYKFENDLENIKNTRKPLSDNDNIVTKDETKTEDKEIIMLLVSSRSMEEIEGLGFEYDAENCKLKCVVCDSKNVTENSDKAGVASGEFQYKPSDGLVFTTKEKLSRSFINLKAHLKVHILKNKLHCSSLAERNKLDAAECEAYSINRKAGMNLGRAAVKNYILGRPYRDFENDVLIMKKSGGIVGELNHSVKFPAKFRGSVCKVVNSRVRKFVTTPLKQTAHLPPVALSADKGTFKGTPRQFCAIVTVNPGGENFLEVMTAGQPVVSEGSSGRQLAINMKSAFDYIGVEASQIKSGVYDGVYQHVNITKHLLDLYPDLKEDDFLFTWDPLHLSGLADKHTCKAMEHKWINKFNKTCQQIYGVFKWGASHVNLRNAALKLGIRPRNLVNFSETRFANSKRRVYQVIFEMFPAIIDCLNYYIKKGEDNRSGVEAANKDVREKCDMAKELRGKIMNVDFLITLAGLCDLYEQFGRVVQVY